MPPHHRFTSFTRFWLTRIELSFIENNIQYQFLSVWTLFFKNWIHTSWTFGNMMWLFLAWHCVSIVNLKILVTALHRGFSLILNMFTFIIWIIYDLLLCDMLISFLNIGKLLSRFGGRSCMNVWKCYNFLTRLSNTTFLLLWL